MWVHGALNHSHAILASSLLAHKLSTKFGCAKGISKVGAKMGTLVQPSYHATQCNAANLVRDNCDAAHHKRERSCRTYSRVHARMAG